MFLRLQQLVGSLLYPETEFRFELDVALTVLDTLQPYAACIAWLAINDATSWVGSIQCLFLAVNV